VQLITTHQITGAALSDDPRIASPMDENRSEQRYVSPDGTLTFLVVREPGDISLGFHATSWHTHGDILAALSGLPIEQAVAEFVSDVTSNKSVIAISTVDGRVADIWVTDDPAAHDPYQPENETVTFRYWDGTPFMPVEGSSD
jgi:hypothetical protein